MFHILYRLILTTILLHELYAQNVGDKVLSKNVKSSEFKQKLEKTSEALKDSPAEPVPLEDISEPVSVLGIEVPTEFKNSTVIQDHHTYYNSTFYLTAESADSFWVDLNDAASSAKVHDMLSNSHRQATTVELSFEFPFYGHLMKNITIATGGFLYMGDYMHNWIAATQYIAPLMANFDTSQATHSVIKYRDNGTAFTVLWENVYIQNRMIDGAFTFQVTLEKSGDIIFVYKDIPYSVSNISENQHPVKIGISDAYILERSLFFVRRKTIYEYHRIDMLKRNVSSNTAMYFTALPTCPGYRDCSSCLSAEPKLECGWCESLQRCSDGIDRARQSWVSSGCSINKVSTCPVPSHSGADTTVTEMAGGIESTTKSEHKPFYKPASVPPYHINKMPDISDNKIHERAHLVQEEEKRQHSAGLTNMSTGAVVTVALFALAVLVTIGWVFYAYKFPQSSAGQFLIKYRPSQWTMRAKEEATMTSNSRHF